MTSNRLLVTGATGMVGSAVARKALSAGYRVRALVRRDSDRALLDGLDLEIVEGDLATPSAVVGALDEVEAVVHAAAHIGDWGLSRRTAQSTCSRSSSCSRPPRSDGC